MTTTEQKKAALEAVLAISDAIHDLGEVPNGHLYAQVMGYLTLDQYMQILGILKRAGVIEESVAHVLRWTGPRREKAAS